MRPEGGWGPAFGGEVGIVRTAAEMGCSRGEGENRDVGGPGGS